MSGFSEANVDILGVGNPLLDISTNVPAEMLEKYGVKPGDIILAEEKHMPVYKELEENFKVDYIAGGATQNSIRVASWMLGNTGTAYMGCVGADAYGTQLKTCAEASGVIAHYMVDESTPTGTCAVLIKDAERTLVTNLAAANNYTKAHLEGDEAQALITKAKVIYSAGFFLTSGGPACTTYLGEHCAKTGKLYCLNLSAPFICEFFTEQLDQTMPFVDIVFANETEAASLGKVKGWGEDLGEIALQLAAMPKASGTHARMVVFTQGASQTVVVLDGKVSMFPVEPLAKELLVDTNGAGDAFVGGFLSQLAKGEPLAACINAGHWAARVIIQRSGCTYPEECAYSTEA